MEDIDYEQKFLNEQKQRKYETLVVLGLDKVIAYQTVFNVSHDEALEKLNMKNSSNNLEDINNENNVKK